MSKRIFKIKEIKAIWNIDSIYFRVKDILSLVGVSLETFMREFDRLHESYENNHLYIEEDLYISESFFFNNYMQEKFVEEFEHIFPSVNMFLDQRYGILVEASEKERKEKK